MLTVFIQSSLLILSHSTGCRPLTKSYFKLLPRYTFLCESWKSPPAVPNTRRNQFEFNLGFFRASFCWLSVVFTLFDFCNFIHNKLDLGFEKPIGVNRGVWNNILFDKSRLVRCCKWWGPRYRAMDSNGICRCEVTKTNYAPHGFAQARGSTDRFHFTDSCRKQALSRIASCLRQSMETS